MHASSSRDDGRVGEIVYQHADAPRLHYTDAIYANEEFDIGREDVQLAFNSLEPTISTHHLRFRCVMFDDEEPNKVAPMVYVRVLSRNAVMLKHSDYIRLGADVLLNKDDGDVLLNQGDVLQLTPGVSIMFTSRNAKMHSSNGLSAVQRAETDCFAKHYRVSGRILGSGGNASVFVAVKQSNQRQVACKIVPRPQPRNSSEKRSPSFTKKREDLAREYNALKNLNHPNIIRLEKVFCGSRHIYIFQELITGGDLLSYIQKMEALTEPQAAVIVRQVLKAVDFLHQSGIVHRDIKPENILMTSWRDGARVVLTDFGQARMLGDAQSAAGDSAVIRMQSVVGTSGYCAPEVITKERAKVGYSKAIDIWSIGCITATLLTNQLIFPEEDSCPTAADECSSTALASDRWTLSVLDTGAAWAPITKGAKSFVKGCLTVDEAERLTAENALLHPWFMNRHYSAELEAVYDRAIRGWEPRDQDANVIEFIDTNNAVTAAEKVAEEAAEKLERVRKQRVVLDDTRSPHFHSQHLSRPHAGTLQTRLINHDPRPKSRYTPIPSIVDSAKEDARYFSEVEVAARQALFASPTYLTDSPADLQDGAQHTWGSLSLAGITRPGTLADDSLPPAPGGWTQCLANSQMADAMTPGFLSGSYGLDEPAAAARKRTSSFVDIDKIENEGVTQGTSYSTTGVDASPHSMKRMRC